MRKTCSVILVLALVLAASCGGRENARLQPAPQPPKPSAPYFEVVHQPGQLFIGELYRICLIDDSATPFGKLGPEHEIRLRAYQPDGTPYGCATEEDPLGVHLELTKPAGGGNDFEIQRAGVVSVLLEVYERVSSADSDAVPPASLEDRKVLEGELELTFSCHPSLEPTASIGFLTDASVVQPGYVVGFKAETAGIADLTLLEWNANLGTIDHAETDEMWWWPPDVGNGTELFVSVRYGEHIWSFPVVLKRVLPPPWADEVEIIISYENREWVVSGEAPLLWAQSPEPLVSTKWEVSAGEVGWEDCWITPMTFEDMDVEVKLIWYGIPIASRTVLLKGAPKEFGLGYNPTWPGRVPDDTLEVRWNEDAGAYVGYLRGGMGTPDYGGFETFATIYEMALEDWQPSPLPAEATLQWGDWHLWNWGIELSLNKEEFDTLLPATANLVVRRYATEEDQSRGNVLWEESLPIHFAAAP